MSSTMSSLQRYLIERLSAAQRRAPQVHHNLKKHITSTKQGQKHSTGSTDDNTYCMYVFRVGTNDESAYVWRV